MLKSPESLSLSIALSGNERTRPILDGQFYPQGVQFIPTLLHPLEMFGRQLNINIFHAFKQSQKYVQDQALQVVEYDVATGLVAPDAERALSQNPKPYGIRASREVLERLMRYGMSKVSLSAVSASMNCLHSRPLMHDHSWCKSSVACSCPRTQS